MYMYIPVLDGMAHVTSGSVGTRSAGRSGHTRGPIYRRRGRERSQDGIEVCSAMVQALSTTAALGSRYLILPQHPPPPPAQKPESQQSQLMLHCLCVPTRDSRGGREIKQGCTSSDVVHDTLNPLICVSNQKEHTQLTLIFPPHTSTHTVMPSPSLYTLPPTQLYEQQHSEHLG